MKRKIAPIQRQLMRAILLTSGAVLLLTCASYFAYELFIFRKITRNQLSTIGQIVATNSTAALAFNDKKSAGEILNALSAEKHIVAACLYDDNGHLFSKYPDSLSNENFPVNSKRKGYRFSNAYLEGFQPVVQKDKLLGVLYIKLDMGVIYDRFRLYGLIAFLVIGVSFLLAYFLSRRLQKKISMPILALADTASIISDQHDYSVRAVKFGEDEIGLLTDAFNHMLAQIETQNLEITSFNQKLEQKVSERTIELENANKELEIVNDKLTKSNRDLEQYAYVASHDLQEPLRKIQTFTELAEKNLEEGKETKKYFDKIRSAAQRMADLIRAVLNYSRLGNNEMKFEPVDLNTVMDNIKTDLELLTAEKKAVIKNDTLPVVQGIPLQLNQLFYNLIGNSLKFSNKLPVIKVSSMICRGEEMQGFDEVDKTKEYAELIFEDNGIGFEQQYAGQIFTIFQRLHSRQDYAGTGIGLALVKKIVENHHGFIHVKSELGKGSVFFIYLPVA